MIKFILAMLVALILIPFLIIGAMSALVWIGLYCGFKHAEKFYFWVMKSEPGL